MVPGMLWKAGSVEAAARPGELLGTLTPTLVSGQRIRITQEPKERVPAREGANAGRPRVEGACLEPSPDQPGRVMRVLGVCVRAHVLSPACDHKQGSDRKCALRPRDVVVLWTPARNGTAWAAG